MSTELHPSYQRLPDRQESRFEFSQALVERVHTLLDASFDRVVYDDPVTTTVHLSGQEFAHPSAYVRVRKYEETVAGDTLSLEDNTDWLFEIKSVSGTKERVRLPLGSILVGTAYPELGDFRASFPAAHQVIQEFGRPLLPVLATQSQRTHYGLPGVRLTLDEQTSYYGFRWGELSARRMGENLNAKLELKVEQRDLGAFALQWFDEASAALEGSQVNESKRLSTMYKEFLESQG